MGQISKKSKIDLQIDFEKNLWFLKKNCDFYKKIFFWRNFFKISWIHARPDEVAGARSAAGTESAETMYTQMIIHVSCRAEYVRQDEVAESDLNDQKKIRFNHI